MATHIIQMQPATILEVRSGSPLKISKVGNQTNSQDPQAVNSRVFVGNLNTFQCSKTDVERMFQRYGRIAGISMHKGYAFVQFTNPFDARSACLGENGRTVLGQILDVNLVAEPKPHQTGRKRQNVAKTGNDWDYYYDSYCTAALAPRLVPPLKRPRLMMAQTRSMIPGTIALQPALKPSQTANNLPEELKVYSNPDILICGNCREMFTELPELLEHKKSYCKLRFTCKCSPPNGIKSQRKDAASLLCVQCKDSFGSAWDLMVHVQAAHMVNIYELGVPKVSNGTQHDSTVMSPQSQDKEEDDCQLELDGTAISCKINGIQHQSDVESMCTSPELDHHQEVNTDIVNGFSPTTL